MTDSRPEFLTTHGAARRLGVTPETIRRWIRKGIMSYVEVGPYAAKRLRAADVDKQRVERPGECST